MIRKLGDKVYYSDIHREYPSLRFLGDVRVNNLKPREREACSTAMRILRIGPCASSWILWKDWLQIVRILGLDAKAPTTVIAKANREKTLARIDSASIISHAYDSPYDARINPCPRVFFQPPKRRG
jgi:hypothetical protein